MEKERVEVRTRPRPPLPASQQRAVDQFWMERQEEIEATVDFKGRMLPMARLKKVIVRATEDDEDGMMISADTPAFLSKLCELFVQELAVRAWACARSHNRRIILGADIAEAVASTESYDFLLPVLLDHLHLVAHGGRAAPATARLVTRKRHMPDPDPRRAARRAAPRVRPVVSPAPPSSARYAPYPIPRVLRESAPPPEDELTLPAPPMNYTTRGCVFFRDGNTFEGDNSAAEMVRAPPPLAASAAGELQTSTVPPAPFYFYSYPVIDDNLDAFALGNTEPGGNTENPAGNADGNVNGAIGVAHGGQQQELSGNLGNTDPSRTGNESPMHYMLLEEVLLDQDLLFPPDAADMFPVVSALPDPEDFIIDQDVLHDVFADPSSSSSSCSN
ncbi:uncharacterized protein LOC124657079 [Lolium rigidum]|uniref:uncharacterized protein LOC124657079 n=1 Tax=Lolium rigidum TaxID=89674 RepID=UPI001F5DC985|nr:uncharacterized protein LOC124657079 [Lolium rigidum]